MTDDLVFEIDTAGDNVKRSSRLFYISNGNIEESVLDHTTKPSQERPSILKQKAKRYHEKEKKFVPGKISYELRKALGLRLTDVPEHIYRMRHLGYPPGWLKKAEVTTENISITGANAVVNTSKNTSLKYDGDKLYEYPGFNTYKNYDQKYDYCQERGFMPIQQNTLLENFLNFLSEQHLLGKEATHIKDIRGRNIDKDTDFNLPMRQAPTPVANSTPIVSKRIKKHSGVDLSDGEVEDDDDECMSGSPNDSINVNGAPSSLNQSSADQSKTEVGTFLLVPTSSKPTLEQFSEGINDHRLYENLPNVGGTYKKVLDVLKRIQT